MFNVDGTGVDETDAEFTWTIKDHKLVITYTNIEIEEEGIFVDAAKFYIEIVDKYDGKTDIYREYFTK